jgi:hypothetical protein
MNYSNLREAERLMKTYNLVPQATLTKVKNDVEVALLRTNPEADNAYLTQAAEVLKDIPYFRRRMIYEIVKNDLLHP